jgi:putative endonuclease
MTIAQAKGAAAEALAARHLADHGLRLLGRNFRVRGGEIDLICQDGDTTVFVEVRRRDNPDSGGAGASITVA